MRFAIYDGRRITAAPHLEAVCPQCHKAVKPKCGAIVSWHWAHLANDCDPWAEPESEWHINWKNVFPSDWQEVVIGAHRADVKTPRIVVEFQSSSISQGTIIERESHYGDMVWVVNASKFWDNLRMRNKGEIVTFRWLRPRLSWLAAKKPLFLDPGGGRLLLRIGKLYPPEPAEYGFYAKPCAGWGRFITEAQFLAGCGLPE